MLRKYNETLKPELVEIDYSHIKALDLNIANGKAIEYYENALITRASVYRNKLYARVGNFLEEYDVEITVHGNEIASACTCRHSRSICSHAIALLYAWVNDGRDFLDIEATLDQIKDLSKDRLVEIIINIIQYNPALAEVFLAKRKPEWDEIEPNLI